MSREQAERLQRDWLEACEQAGIPAITTDTSARIYAIMYVHGGGQEDMVLNKKFVNDVLYIQRRFHIMGGEVPDEEFVSIMKRYINELSGQQDIPEWARLLMKERYGMNLHG